MTRVKSVPIGYDTIRAYRFHDPIKKITIGWDVVVGEKASWQDNEAKKLEVSIKLSDIKSIEAPT